MHLMLDLETLAVNPRTVIIEAGFALFEPQDDGIIASINYLLDINEQLANGRKVDFSTIQWWMRQSEEARYKLCDRNDSQIFMGFEFHDQLITNFDWSGIKGIWSHGSIFDIAILEDFFRQMKRDIPWKYNIIRDTRTLFSLYPITLVKPTLAHSAEADAIAQALSVQLAYKAHLHAQKNNT